MANQNFFQPFSPKRLVQIQNDQNWPFQVFSDSFPQKDWILIQNSQNWPFQIFFPKKTGTNSEWPKMAIPNFFPTIFPKKTGTNSKWPKMV